MEGLCRKQKMGSESSIRTPCEVSSSIAIETSLGLTLALSMGQEFVSVDVFRGMTGVEGALAAPKDNDKGPFELQSGVDATKGVGSPGKSMFNVAVGVHVDGIMGVADRVHIGEDDVSARAVVEVVIVVVVAVAVDSVVVILGIDVGVGEVSVTGVVGAGVIMIVGIVGCVAVVNDIVVFKIDVFQ